MDPLFTETGVFLALEGGEGAGKSTQAVKLVEWLESLGHGVLLTREPGATEVGKILRHIVLDNDTGELSPRTEVLLYAADKAEHVDQIVLPALAEGTIVLTDRYVDSLLAYQGAGRLLDPTEVEHIARWATSSLRPHLTIVLDIDPAIGHARFEGADRIESEPLEFHQRVRQHFLDLAAADPQHYLVVGGGGTPDEIHATIRQAVEPWLGQASA
ncbi:dTMP kinase [Aeromicrobium sp. 9AM]|uniref:dTMP kinase n=1 Tax=Aeromicrobium sp. 9AM TaxID=2653126 RepID=UPI0012F3F8D6|nr:dTMP kinase [Aeromicrobium sp. 9AM]VXB48380.1 Thymidylate kinase [Aeromicrobium sp. 9AM]